MAVLFEFKKCQHCGSEETVMAKVCAKDTSFKPGAVVASRSEFTPTQNITAISTPLIRGVFKHYDVCAGCGIERCIRVEEASLPAAALGLQMGMPKK